MPEFVTLGLAVFAAVVAAVLAWRAQMTQSREGKILAFMALFLLPLAAGALGFSAHMERATTREFCLSCM
ncbi:MAG: hypothetical protein WDO18_23160 [Acidobacteriota bacterium]